MGEWISISDKVPDVKRIIDKYATWRESVPVLAIRADKRYSIVQYIVENDGSKYWASDDGGTEEITHWMPLPEYPMK